MSGIDLSLIIHHLNINLNHYSVKQKQKIFTLKHYENIKLDVNKLLKVRFIRSVDNPM